MGSPDPPASRLCKPLFRHCRLEFVSAVTERGSYPFPFRTRKSSPSSPMVPGPRARESRSPLDSRSPSPKRRRAPFLYIPLHFVTLSPPRPVSTGRLRLTGPLPSRRGASSFYMTARAIVTVQLRPALALATMPGRYRALVAHGPLPQTLEGAFFMPAKLRFIVLYTTFFCRKAHNYSDLE